MEESGLNVDVKITCQNQIKIECTDSNQALTIFQNVMITHLNEHLK